MNSDAILDLARQVNPHTAETDISLLKGGFSSQAYKIESNDAPFVLLVQREGGISSTNYGHAYVVLTLLHQRGFQHIPSPLWLQNDHTALALSFNNGVPSDAFDFTHNSIDPKTLSIRVMDILLDTADVGMDEYKKLAEKLTVPQPPIETPVASAKEYGTDWFEIVKASCPDQTIVEWLAPRIQRSVEAALNMPNTEPTLMHGDPSNPNILITPTGDFTLIDWDSSRFQTKGPEFLIGYTTHLTNFMKPYRSELIEYVAKRLHIPEDELTSRVHEYRRNSEVFDVNWAAMMMAKVANGEVEGEMDYFRDTALERMRDYETSFE